MHVEIPDRGELPQVVSFKSPTCSCHLSTSALTLVKTCLRAEGRVYDLSINQKYAECHGIDTMSTGSMSPDLD